MLLIPGRPYRTMRNDVVTKLERRERDYGPHGHQDTHPWLVTLLTHDDKTVQHWYTRDGHWSAGARSLLDLAAYP